MFESLWCDPWIQPIRIQNRKAVQEESRKLVDVDQFDEKTLCFSPKKTTVKMVEFAYSLLGKVVELIEDE